MNTKRTIDNLLAFFFMAGIASAALAQTSASAGDSSTQNIQVDCQSLFAFGAGKFDSDNVVLGVDRVNWNARTRGIVTSAAHTCIQRGLNELGERGQWTLDKANFLSKVERDINNKATAIVQLNDAKKAEARELAAKQKEKDRQEAELAKADAAKKIADCEAGPTYRLYQAEENIIVSRENLAYVRDQVARERKIARTSGVRNLAADYQNGRDIIDLQESMKASWQQYKKLGGKASSIQAVQHKSEDPCSTLRSPPAQ